MEVVFIVTRELHSNFAVLLVTSNLATANAMVERHYLARVAEDHCTLQVNQSFEPSMVAEGTMVRTGGSENHPVLQEAPPVVECFRRLVELLESNETRSRYMVVQH